MKLATPIKLGVPALIILAIAAVMVFMAFGSNGAAGGLGETSKLRGTVSWIHTNSEGAVLGIGAKSNTINASDGLDEVLARVIGTAASGTDDAFDTIAALCDTAGNDDPVDGTDAASLCDNLDIESGSPGGTKFANGAGAVAEVAETGNGTIILTFEADGGAVTIMQIVLNKAAAFDNTGDGGVAIVDADVLAYQDVADVALADTDTVQYTWTLDFD